MLKKMSIILMGLFLICSPICAEENNITTMSTQQYTLPSNIEFKVIEKPEKIQQTMRFAIEITSKIGTLKDLNIFYYSSKDLKIMSEKTVIKSLKQDEKRTIKVIATRTEDEKSVLGSWIRLGVKYVPDYDAMLKVASNMEKYPDPVLREILISDVKTAQETSEPVIDAVRHFINEDQVEE